MKTPDTIEGFLAECIMDRIDQNVKSNSGVHHYRSATYYAIMEVLSEHLPRIQSIGKGMERKEYEKLLMEMNIIFRGREQQA